MKSYIVFSNWVGEVKRYEINGSIPITTELIRILQENHTTLDYGIKIEFVLE